MTEQHTPVPHLTPKEQHELLWQDYEDRCAFQRRLRETLGCIWRVVLSFGTIVAIAGGLNGLGVLHGILTIFAP